MSVTMSSSEDEQDDNNVFDQLKSIKAFTVDQLYLLHPDVGCPPTNSTNRDQPQSNGAHHDQNLYQNLVDYEQLRHKLSKLKNQVKHLNKKTFDHVDEVWVFNEEAPRKIGMCQQGKIAETTLRYKKATVSSKHLNALDLSFSELSEMISKDYIYYSFESQMKRFKIATQLSISYQISDPENRALMLKLAITTLIDFIKHLGESKSDFVLQCRKWLRGLIKRFLEQGKTDDYRFVIAQLAKGPSGTADWSADLIECKPFEQVIEFESTPQYITHCSSLLSELFDNLKSPVKRATISTDENHESTANEYSDQNWSLIDPRFNCSEELNLSSSSGNNLSESDVIKLCLRIPVAQIFRAYVRKCLDSDHLRLETDKNYEYIMLKLLTIGTIIIRTYQTGLETFNSIQYGNLIEYLSSQIRRTVIVLSDQWTEFKRRLKGVDNALIMRLQVEYDNFILRSILIILELRECGIWRHLSRIDQETTRINDCSNNWSADSLRPAFVKLLQATGLTSSLSAQPSSQEVESPNPVPPSLKSSSNSLTYEFSVEWFREVSEPMLWHILWQFYHNAFVNSCDYHSENYWLEKFREKSVVYLFVNKIRDSSPGECSYLLNSITNMLLSRTRQESKLITFIATEIFNLSFKHESMKSKITKKGTESLVRCAEKFPNLISLFMNFMVGAEVDEDVVELFKKCTLSGWICDEDEVEIIAKWLIEYSIDSTHNKVARLVISKLMLNSPQSRVENINRDGDKSFQTPQSKSRRPPRGSHCFIDLKLRRRFALILYESSIHHLPENNDFGPQSLGASVEVALGSLYCEPSSAMQNNLIELAVDTSYQQFYVWIWRLLLTFKIHILNQPETDWNDVQSRSGTSRSIKNTVLFNDSFHPVPSIQDSECLPLSEGIKNQSPVASFIYLLITDVTWQVDTLESCLKHLNMLANSGHLTPSLIAMKFLTICHLNDLSETVTKDPQCLEYFTTIITSSFDSTRLASLMISQMQNLKQYRQLQLSQFYINILLEVAVVILKKLSSSWFSGDEYSLEKVACLLDYIVKFNFTTQRVEIIRKFYDCSYSSQGCKPSSGWFGSLFTPNSAVNANSTRREFSTTLHVLTQKFKKFFWLRWITTECDTLRLEKIWEDIVVYLSTNEEANLDSAIKKVCPQLNSSILKSSLPIYSWINEIFDIVESDLNHPLCPLIWYNFFLNYFANSLNGVSVGLKLVPQETLTKLMARLDSLFNYHLYKHRNWTSTSALQQNSLAQLYRAYRLWLQDSSLQDAYVDIDRLREDYLVPVLKAVMESSTEGACLQYIDIQSIETQNRNLSQIWSTATRLEANHLIRDMIFVDSNQDESMEILTSVDDEASDAASLIVKPQSHNKAAPENNKSLANAEEELKKPLQGIVEENHRPVEEVIELVKQNFHTVFEESSIFGSNISELDKVKSEIVELIQQLYTNKKRQVVRVVPCADGTECSGPARIVFDIEEATIDDRKSECFQDRQRQCEELVNDLLLMPTNRTVQSTILIEDYVRQIIGDADHAKLVIESLLRWISEPKNYNQLNGSYHAANHLLKTVLEILSSSHEVDTYNATLIDVCLDHPGSVQIFSPHLSPSSCSSDCFLELYKKISSKHTKVGPIAMFVLLSKFDINFWLKNIRDREMHQDIIRTTCSALKQMGKQPDDSFILTLDLYKHHLHVELAAPDRRRKEEISLVLSQFLMIMDEQSLDPSLWLDFMAILGLDKNVSMIVNNGIGRAAPPKGKSTSAPANEAPAIPPISDIEHNESTIACVIEDIARLADYQIVLDYHALDNLMKMISQFVSAKCETIDVNLLEHYQDYLNQFGVVMLSITLMWLRTVGEHYPDNHDLIWKQFMDVWGPWVFLSKNCQNIGRSDYSLIVSQYVAAIRYMIFKMPDSTQVILQSVLSSLADYVTRTKEVVYLELTILQRSLKNLPWSSLLAAPNDIENLASLSEQENYNISDLISHILLQINIKESLQRIHEHEVSLLPHISERLATSIVLQSTHLKGFRLHGSFFTLIPVDQISKISSLILRKMEFINLEHSQNNKLLVNLLRFMCIKLEFGSGDSSSPPASQTLAFNVADSLDRSIIYARFVSNYLVDLIRNHPPVLKYHKSYLYAIMDNSLQDLKILLSPDVDITKKIVIYESLLGCCNSNLIDESSRLMIAKSLIKSNLLKNRPIVVMEIFHVIGQIISDARVLVYIVDKMINLYLNMNGHYEKVWKSFCLKALPSDLYLNACVEENAPLALLVYFEALSRNGQEDSMQISSENNSLSGEPVINNNQIWSSFFHWISQLSVVKYVTGSNVLKSNDTKVAIVWLRLLDMLEPNLYQFVRSSCKSSNSNGKIQDSSDAGAPNDLAKRSEGGDQTNLDASTATPPSQMALNSSQKSLVDFLKHLISIYDSQNAGGLWSYLKSTRTEQSSRTSILALAMACFLADKTLVCLNSLTRDDDLPVGPSEAAPQKQQAPIAAAHQPTEFHDEIGRLRKVCLSKLELARKSKYYLENVQFIEALIETVNQNDKVQYSEGVQLITTFVRSNYLSAADLEDCAYISKILPSFSE